MNLGTKNRNIIFYLTITNGTNAFILVDYNDGSPTDIPIKGLINNQYIFNHTFINSGYYNVNITVFNLVSSLSKIFSVCFKLLIIIQNNFRFL